MSKKYITDNIKIDGQLLDGSGSAGTSGQILSSTGTATDWINLSDISGVDGSGSAERLAVWSDSDTISYHDNLRWDGEKLMVESGNSSTSSKTVSITHTRNDSNVSTQAITIDANFSGADTTTTDRTNAGLYIDLDSSADGDASNEVRSYGVWVDARITGYNDLLRGGYFFVESNNTTEKTAEITGVYGLATHDSSSTNGGVSNMFGVRGVTAIQDYGDVDNTYAVHGLVQIANNRNANVDNTHALYGEIQIDEATALSYGSMYGCRVVIDNNEGSVPTFSDQYLFYGAYQGTTATGAYGIYVQGDRHYLAGSVGIGETNPARALEVKHSTQQGVARFVSGSTTMAFIDLKDANTTADNKVRFGAVGNELSLWANGGERMRIDSSGNVGIGETSIDARLHISTAAAGLVNQKFESVGSAAWRMGIPASQTYFAFDNANDNLSAPKVVIDSGGQVGIGTPSPSYNLHILDGDPYIALNGTTSSDDISLLYHKGGTLNLIARASSTVGGQVDIVSRNNTGDTDLANFENTGRLVLPQYGSGTFTGTAQKMLAVDATGNVIEETLPAGPGGIGAGTYGSTADNTKIDTITVDAYGRVTAIATGETGEVQTVSAGTNLNSVGTSTDVTLNLDSSIDLTSVTTDELSYPYPTATNQFHGEIVTFGSFNGTIVAGDVIVYTTAGVQTGWFLAQGNVTYSKGMLGIAMGTTPSAGILIKGFARHASFASGNLGSPLYLSPSTAGDTTSTIPSSTNNIVRIVGYMLNPTNDEIFFDPDKSWVQVS